MELDDFTTREPLKERLLEWLKIVLGSIAVLAVGYGIIWAGILLEVALGWRV